LTKPVDLDFLIVEVSKSHSVTHIRICRTPGDGLSAIRRHMTHKKQVSMIPGGFKPTAPAREQLKTHALNRAATGK
jgi:hypothetical protein